MDLPLVLHGGSGIPDADITRSLSLGIAKINIGAEIRKAFMDGLRASLEAVGPGRKVSPPDLSAGHRRPAGIGNEENGTVPFGGKGERMNVLNTKSAWVTETLGSLSLEERIAQLLFPSLRPWGAEHVQKEFGGASCHRSARRCVPVSRNVRAVS